MTTGIVGVGLIGGSMALDLRRRHFSDTFLGVEADPAAAEAALRMGLVDRVVSFEDCIAAADLVILSIPVDAATRLLPKALDEVARRAQQHPEGPLPVVIDVCSVKEKILQSVKYHPMRRQYVATHPMAGTEYNGPWAAVPGLFDGRAGILCDAQDSAPQAVDLAERLYAALNMRLVHMSAASHDVHTAYISHLSHIISFALAQTVLDKEKDEKHIFDLASGGFSSTVRLAKSNPAMWVPIFLQNRENLLRVTDAYLEKVSRLREAIAAFDEEGLKAMIEDANRIKRIVR